MVELGFSPFCSSSCVREHDRLRREASRTVEVLREHVETRPRRLRVLELDEDAAAVVALSEAGATVWQIARYTALDPDAVERLVVSEDEARAARREARERARRRRKGNTRAAARRAGAPDAAA